MDVSSPISSVIPSLDGPVLAVLAGTTGPLALSEVRRLAGRGSLAGVRRVLLRLVSVGVVHSVPGGYILNRQHLAAPAVELLARLHGSLADRIRNTVESWDEPPQLVGLFGSAARRDGDEQSDIDLIVVSDSPDVEEVTDSLSADIRAWTGNDAQILTKSTADLRRLRRAKEPILAEWARDLVVIAGDPRLLRGAA